MSLLPELTESSADAPAELPPPAPPIDSLLVVDLNAEVAIKNQANRNNDIGGGRRLWRVKAGEMLVRECVREKVEILAEGSKFGEVFEKSKRRVWSAGRTKWS